MDYQTLNLLFRCGKEFSHAKIRLHELSDTECMICSYIYSHENCSQDEVSAALRVDKTTVGKALASLENKACVVRVQDNLLETIDVTEMPACQGIDAGMNRLKSIDVSKNPELVELYINDNDFSGIDISHNPKLKYFYCHNNRIAELDIRSNPLLRHLNATGNPMKTILSLAPQRNKKLPLELYAGDGGCVGLKFNPFYNAQWKETGEWQQSYYACPDEGFRFAGWYENGVKVCEDTVWTDEYDTSRILKAVFEKE